MSVTTGSTFGLGLTGIFNFVRAVAGDLPDPSGVSVYSHGRTPRAHLLFGSVDDLRNWAAYLQAPVTTKSVPDGKTIHHGADAQWGPVDGKMVSFHMVHIEDVPERFAIPKDCDAAEWS